MCWCGPAPAPTPWITSRKCWHCTSPTRVHCPPGQPRGSDHTGPSGLGRGAGVLQAVLRALLCPHPCSDDEKSRQMWRRYQEREDSRISGEQGWGKGGQGWAGSGVRNQGFHPALSHPSRSLRWAAEEFSDLQRVRLLLHSLRPFLGPVPAHPQGEGTQMIPVPPSLCHFPCP